MVSAVTAVDWVSQVILFLGYPGIALLMVLESMVFPLPSEAILPFAGYLVSMGQLNLFLVVLAATIGSLIGAWISYEMGSYGGRAFLKRYGKYLLINERHLRWTEGWFERYGEKTIFFSRLITVVRHFISIPAGTTRMNRAKFFIYTFAGAFLWNLFLVSAGVFLGKEWHKFSQYSKPFEIGIIIVIFGLAAWFLFREVEKRTWGKLHKPKAVRKAKRPAKRK